MRGKKWSLLSELTHKSAVEAALDEFDLIGRDAFLGRHRFGPSNGFFVIRNGRWYESRSVLGAAFKLQLPDREPPTPKQLESSSEIALVFQRLGFKIRSRVSEFPPRIGDAYASRQAVKDLYGGDINRGIVVFPDEETVNIFSSEGGPYVDDEPSLYRTFSYRGEGMTGDQQLSAPGNTRLEKCRVNRTAARFWFQPSGGEYRFISWVTVQGRAWVPGLDSKDCKRWEIKWFLHPLVSPEGDARPTGIEVEFEAQPAPAKTPPKLDAGDLRDLSVDDLYELMASEVVRAPAEHVTRSVKQYARSEIAREATLLRARNHCENPECGGMPIDKTPSGSAILEVDHIKELSAGGHDHPSNMIALCPNCHAMKTRGSRSKYWQKLFRESVRKTSQ